MIWSSVSKLVKDLDISNNFKNDRPGKKWMQLFLKRHPEVAARTVEKITKSRSLVSEMNIRGWLLQIEQYLKQENVLDLLKNPHRVFNCDESGFMLCTVRRYAATGLRFCQPPQRATA